MASNKHPKMTKGLAFILERPLLKKAGKGVLAAALAGFKLVSGERRRKRPRDR